MKNIVIVVCLISLVIFIGCAGTNTGLKILPEPDPNSVMVFGNILLENISQDFPFSYWDMPMKVVLLGKTEDGIIHHYETSTSVTGYFCIPNLPRGSYTLKAVIFQESGTLPSIIVNDWQSSDSRFYLMKHPERGIEYTGDVYQPVGNSRLIDLGIIWFGLGPANVDDISDVYIGKVLVANQTESLNAKRFWRDGYPYTRETPLSYFKKEFPNSGWWKL